MSLEQPNDLECAILEHLSTYRFLTVRQLLTLGVTKSERHLQATLHSMAGLHRKPRAARRSDKVTAHSSPTRYRPYRLPAIKVLAFGLEDNRRMPFVFTLSPQGAKLLSELRGDEMPVYASAAPSFPRQEYRHRLGCIDCHIAIRTWAERHRAQLDFYHVDFNFSRKLKGRPISDTRVDLKDARVIKPDAIFQLTPNDRRRRLCALEFWAGLDVAIIERKLDTYRHALDDGAIERAFAYEHGVRVLAIFQHESTLRNVFERLSTRSDFFGVFSPHLLFKTLEDLHTDVVYGWRQLGKPGYVPLFSFG
jgi:hypothetical protein